ncbi:hypothetical protein B566_EDAN005792 [Ephemera danica]|nr:hypothetical protein B566_EDAN005792 [Ephemera danica]
MNPAYFLTGTDTEIGKTFVTCALLHRARQLGICAAGMKPVAAGTDNEGRNDDVERIRAANGLALPDAVINPYCFAAPVAPHLAAAEEGRRIDFAPILTACASARARVGLLIVEGVGGFRVPLDVDRDSADLAVALGLPVILVVGLRLGCINHALLSAEAIVARGLTLAGWVANTLEPNMARIGQNIETLRARLPAPLLGALPWVPGSEPATVADRLTLPTL